MKEVYIAYFDFLGFKEFILNNENEVVDIRMNHIFRDIQMALGQGNYNEPRNGIITPNFTNSKINCLNISDTVVFWTNDAKFDSMRELFNVAYEFNWKQNLFNFPLRGAVIKGKIKIVNSNSENLKGATFGINCLYGEGIVNAHLKAESQNWAGTVIDDSALADFSTMEEMKKFIDVYAVKCSVPYKNNLKKSDEYVFRFTKGKITKVAFEKYSNSITRVFSQDNKPTDNSSVQIKIQNTKNFLKSFIE